MLTVQFLLCAIFLAVCFSSIPEANCQQPAIGRTLYVDRSRGPFRTIQSAIDRVPSDNRVWTRIYVRAGTYREQVIIPKDKPYIYLQGDGFRRTGVVSSAGGNIGQDATLISEADNIVFEGITFMNSYNYPLGRSEKPIIPAPAVYVSGDKCAFYRCAFIGVQDTLWDVSGRHYFKYCTIQGAADFIFGAGQSIYEECSISVVAGVLNGPGFITAQGRSSEDDSNGFVFKNCNIFGNGMTYLGRPWRPFARVIFYNTTMSNVVVPLGWSPGDFENPGRTSLGEYNCRGPGANRAVRVPWEYKFDAATLNAFTNIKYVDSEGWMETQKQALNLIMN